MDLSVIVPVYNGAACIADTVHAVSAHLAARGDCAEIIVVDDGSTDATLAVLRTTAGRTAVPTRVLHSKANQGKGAAIAHGVAVARGARIVFLDADLAYPPSEIDSVCAALDAGADVAIASRVHAGSRYIISPSFFRYLYTRHVAGRLFNWLVRLVLLPGITDSQAGLKGFSATAAAQLFDSPLPHRFSFDLGLLFRARRLGLRIQEVGVRYRYDREPTTVRFALDTLVVIRDLTRLRIGALGRMPRRPRRKPLGAVLDREGAAPTLICAATIGVLGLVVARLVLQNGWLALAAWLLLLTALGGLTLRVNRDARPWHALRSVHEAALFAALLGVTAALRLVDLDVWPPMVHLDSAECGLRGLALLRGEVADPFDFSPWYNTPYLSFLPYAASFAITGGVSTFALRLPSAIAGTLALVPLYLLARSWFGVRAALLTGALFAVSHPAIHFSRIGLWNIQSLLLALCAFALLSAAWRRGSVFAAYAAGATSGLALYSYTAGRLVPIVAVAFLALRCLGTRRRRALRTAAYYGLGLAAAAAPLVLSYVKNPGVLALDRTSAVWVLAEEHRPHVEATLGVTTAPAILWQQAVRTLQGFVTLGDTSSQYGTEQPLLSPWMALLAAVGLLHALRRASAPRYQFLLLWAGCGLLLGSVLVLDPPSYTRLIVVFPIPYILAAVGLAALAHQAQRWVRLRRVDLAAVAVVVASVAAAYNLSGYHRFVEFMEDMPREWDVLRVVDRLGPGYDYYLFTGPFLLADSPIFQLFAADTRAVSGFSEQDLPERLSRDSIFLVQGEFRGLGATIAERYPGAAREEIEEDKRRQVVIYRCAEDNACRTAFN